MAGILLENENVTPAKRAEHALALAAKMKPLDMTADPGCPPTPQTAEVVVVNGGKLANVFVYVKEGLPQGSFAVPAEPVVLDQKGCRYIPHMLGIVAGQQLMVLADNPDQLFRYMATALFIGPMLIPLFLARNRQPPKVDTPDSREA